MLKEQIKKKKFNEKKSSGKFTKSDKNSINSRNALAKFSLNCLKSAQCVYVIVELEYTIPVLPPA